MSYLFNISGGKYTEDPPVDSQPWHLSAAQAAEEKSQSKQMKMNCNNVEGKGPCFPSSFLGSLYSNEFLIDGSGTMMNTTPKASPNSTGAIFKGQKKDTAKDSSTSATKAVPLSACLLKECGLPILTDLHDHFYNHECQSPQAPHWCEKRKQGEIVEFEPVQCPFPDCYSQYLRTGCFLRHLYEKHHIY